MKIVPTKSELFKEEQIKNIEDHYSAKFVCDTCLKATNGDWVNMPVAVFYQSNPPLDKYPDASHYFGLYYDLLGRLMITNAISALEPFSGLIDEEGNVVYSRYRHDYRVEHGMMVDGGRDYLKHSDKGKSVTLQIVEDKLVVKG